MTQQNMVKVVIIHYKFNKSFTLALNFTFAMIPHSLVAFKLTMLNVIYSNIYLFP